MAHGDASEGGKLANAVSSQYSSHYLRTWCIQHYYRWCPHLGCQQSTKLTSLADLNGLVRFADRRNLVSACVPSHFKSSLTHFLLPMNTEQGSYEKLQTLIRDRTLCLARPEESYRLYTSLTDWFL